MNGGPVFSIHSGSATLLIQENGTAYGVVIQLTNGAAAYQQTNLMAVEVVNHDGGATWLTGAYATATNLGGGRYQCAGTITTANGSVFKFTDNFKAYDNAGAFEIDRSVQVSAANAGDAGFSSKLTFQRSVAGHMSDYDFFMPAIWYQTNAGVNNIALANTMTDYFYWYREDRLPLPLFMLREKDHGATFSVIHKNPDGSAFAGENFRSRIIDSRMQFASIGMENNTQPAVGMLFPGTEGERTLIQGGASSTNWALRSHPVSVGFTQTYALVARLTTEPDFPTAMEHTWTAGYAMFHPAIYDCDLNRIYANAVGVLNRYWTNINGAAGEPFRVPWPSGLVTNPLDYNYDLGFVGMQLPNAAILIREGFNTTNAGLRVEGERMAEWWATQALTETGCPKTWYDPHPQTWRIYPTYTRVACEGMIGLLWAWNQEQHHGVAKGSWLTACTNFGNWLIREQTGDGSIARAFDYANNQVADAARDNTSHVVRYLTELYLATGSVRYQQAALSAGAYIYTNCYQQFRYVGGTVDNPDIPDKEAASMALRAFMALYDLTRDSRWLAPAVQTAYYYATWIYSWNVPIPGGDAKVVYPHSRSTTGLSAIATANSGSDSYAATDAFEVYRLYLFTGDTNLLNEAKLMLYNTKQPLDWDPANPLSGYGDPAIFPESLTLVAPRGHGVHYYLPWQTANYLEPMVNLLDTFGSFDIKAIEQQPLASRLAANTRYANNRGYVKPAVPGASPAADTAVPLAAMTVKPVINNSVEPFDLSGVRLLDSPFKQAMDLNARYLLSLEPDRFLHYFRVNAGLQPRAPAYGGWESPTTGAGRCVGHYLSALSLQYRATDDPRFKARVDYIVSELGLCQQTNGFLSAQGDLSPAFAALTAGRGDALLKSRVPWYIQHKMFAGLRDAYGLTGNQQARQILIRMADWAVAVTANLSQEQFQVMLQQEYGGMLEVLGDIYALTGNPKFLALARRFRDSRTFDPLVAGMDKLAGMHANTMLAKMPGAVRLYEWTGEESQRRLAEYFWQQVVGHHTYVIGGNSDHEHFEAPDRLGLDTETAETCNTYNMLKLTRDLFCLDPQVKYGDYYEQALYNDILASQDPKTGMFTYFMSLQPGQAKIFSTPFNSFWCCVGTGMENHTQYGGSIYFHDADNLYVNLYIPSQLTWPEKKVVVRQETDYPNTGDLRFTVQCAHPVTFAFQFRYPGWACPGMTIQVNRQAVFVDAQPGRFVKLARQWKHGDQIKVRLPLSLRAESLPGDPAEKAFLYGPLVLAGDLDADIPTASVLYATNQTDFNRMPDAKVPVLVVDNQPLKAWMQPVEGKPLAFHTRQVGHPQDVLLKPFYQIYDHRYTVYWKVLTPEQWEANGSK